MTTIAAPSIHWVVALPAFLLAGAALALLIATSLVRGRLRRAVGTAVVVAASLGVLADCVVQWIDVSRHGASTTLAHALTEDGFAIVATGVIAVSLGLSILVCDGWLARERVGGVELHILALSSATGAVLMAQANDLVVIFLGLEILSIGLYVLAAFDRRSRRSGEAGLKYFLLGGFSSAIFVYGIALIYGATGTTQLGQLASFLSLNVLKSDGLLLAGTALVLVGFAFKVAAVPFHVWSPDVYEGSPTPIAGYMAAVVKVGAFAAVLRVLASALVTQQAGWRPMVWALAALSMLVGAALAVVQRNVKRLLAYSSISHAGFVLMALWAATAQGIAAALYYLSVYALLVIGSFAVVTVVSADGREDLDDYRGLGQRHPWLAAAFTVLLLAQAGVPFTTGFLAKLAVLEAAIGQLGAAGVTLGVLAMLATAIGGYFYLRVVVLTYAAPHAPAAPATTASPAAPASSDARAVARLAAVGAGILVEDDRDGPEEEHGAAAALTAATATATGAAIPDGDGADRIAVPAATTAVLVMCVVPTVVLGIWAGPLAALASHATMLVTP
ncbi:MAG TPA: NADH-quinone oxidoreductase subunit N [Acidimicrobiales bacterium]|jgi:NADH-quinone oxidoreductase subunit N|nr:NADH-quinone oxidoreductase subunit N [Acidimicrobiales bacterium]